MITINDGELDVTLRNAFTVRPDLLRQFVNAVAKGARTDIRRAVQEKYAVKVSPFNRRMQTSPARTQGDSAVSTITIKGGALSLASFGTVRGTRKGVTFTVIKGRKVTSTKSVFLMRARGGPPLPTVREGRRRFPVRVLKGPSAIQMIQESGVEKQIDRFISDRFDRVSSNFIKRIGA